MKQLIKRDTSPICACRSSSHTGSCSSKRTSFFSVDEPFLLGTFISNKIETEEKWEILEVCAFENEKKKWEAYLMNIFVTIHKQQIVAHCIISPFMDYRSNLHIRQNKMKTNNDTGNHINTQVTLTFTTSLIWKSGSCMHSGTDISVGNPLILRCKLRYLSPIAS